jgi:molybdate transport system substrate-binding protein
MMRGLNRGMLIAMLTAASFATGCGERGVSGSSATATSSKQLPSSSAETGAPGEPLLLLAAASTKDAVEELATAFEKQTGTRVRVSAGASNALATQIASGAPANLFLSANEKWAQHVEEQELAEAVTPLLTNHLALIVPRNNPGQVRSPTDLARPRVKRVALAGENVPAGIYAQQALEALAVYELLMNAGKIVRGQEVRMTLSYVARGEADAGVVYDTDARLEKNVLVVDRFDPKTHDRIVYPLVLVKRDPRNAAARKLYGFLQSTEAATVFEKSGFQRLTGATP